MLIGIIIGFMARYILDYIANVVGLRMTAKDMRSKGKNISVDYLNLRIVGADDGKKGGAYKRTRIGFVCPKDES